MNRNVEDIRPAVLSSIMNDDRHMLGQQHTGWSRLTALKVLAGITDSLLVATYNGVPAVARDANGGVLPLGPSYNAAVYNLAELFGGSACR